MQDTDGALDIAIAGAFPNEIVVIAATGKVLGSDRIERSAGKLRDGQGQILVFLRDVGIGALRVARAEVKEVTLTHLVHVEQDAGHPVLIHPDAVAAHVVLRGEPVAVAVHPVVVRAGNRARFTVFAALLVQEMVLAGGGVDPRAETVDTVRIETGRQDKHRPFEQFFNLGILCGCIVISNRNQGLAAGDLVAVDGTAQVHDQRQFVEVQITGNLRVQQFHMLLADLFQAGLVARRGDIDVHEVALLIGFTEGLDRDTVGNLRQIIHIPGDIAPVGQTLSDFEAVESLRTLDCRIVLCTGERQIVLDGGCRRRRVDRFCRLRLSGDARKQDSRPEDDCCKVFLDFIHYVNDL